MTTLLSLKYHTDPGHGWIQVDKHLLIHLGIANKISNYSYECMNDYAYLEEDCDAGILLDALKASNIEFEIIRTYSNLSPIRSFKKYTYREIA
jgi:hypothetical protein